VNNNQLVPDNELHIQTAFEKYASNRGMSLEQTTSSYKTQATKSAWHAWYYLARFGLSVPVATEAEQSEYDFPYDATLAARDILSYLGYSQDVSTEPGADRKRDHIAKIIAKAMQAKPEAVPVAEGEHPAIALWNSCGEQLKAADDTLRNLSSYVGMGLMLDTENLDYDAVENQIKLGMDNIIEVERTRAMQAKPEADRIAENKETLNELDLHTDIASTGQQRNMVRKMEMGQSMGDGKLESGSDIQAETKLFLKTVAESIAKNCSVAPQLVHPWLYIHVAPILNEYAALRAQLQQGEAVAIVDRESNGILRIQTTNFDLSALPDGTKLFTHAQPANNASVDELVKAVEGHITDLKKTEMIVRQLPEFEVTANEIGKAANELDEALAKISEKLNNAV
jgi:hypothetical protein